MSSSEHPSGPGQRFPTVRVGHLIAAWRNRDGETYAATTMRYDRDLCDIASYLEATRPSLVDDEQHHDLHAVGARTRAAIRAHVTDQQIPWYSRWEVRVRAPWIIADHQRRAADALEDLDARRALWSAQQQRTAAAQHFAREYLALEAVAGNDLVQGYLEAANTPAQPEQVTTVRELIARGYTRLDWADRVDAFPDVRDLRWDEEDGATSHWHISWTGGYPTPGDVVLAVEHRHGAETDLDARAVLVGALRDPDFSERPDDWDGYCGHLTRITRRREDPALEGPNALWVAIDRLQRHPDWSAAAPPLVDA